LNLLKDTLSEEENSKLKRKSQPAFFNPMLATLTHDFFDDPKWIFERKLDGERALVFKKSDVLNIMSRNKKKLNFRYPELVDVLKEAEHDFVIDGEIVTFDGNITSFEKLQERMHVSTEKEAKESRVKIYYYIFDTIFLNGFDLSSLCLLSRKKILKKVIDFKDPIRYVQYIKEHGKKYHSEACKKGWEGIIAKDGESSYVNSRSKKWLKFKCVKQQEFVIGGFSEPKGSRIGFGSLLLGYYKDGKFKYAGEVGTGFDNETLSFLIDKLKKRQSEKSHFGEKEKIKEKSVHWVKPELVCDVGFTEWTKQGKLRHPRYKGLRDDKKASEVIREE
jgi:DNA ligase D-like protein (predicted ligase)